MRASWLCLDSSPRGTPTRSSTSSASSALPVSQAKSHSACGDCRAVKKRPAELRPRPTKISPGSFDGGLIKSVEGEPLVDGLRTQPAEPPAHRSTPRTRRVRHRVAKGDERSPYLDGEARVRRDVELRRLNGHAPVRLPGFVRPMPRFLAEAHRLQIWCEDLSDDRVERSSRRRPLHARQSVAGRLTRRPCPRPASVYRCLSRARAPEATQPVEPLAADGARI